MISENEKSFLKTGFKEVLKLIANAKAEKVFIAEDLNPSMKDKLLAEIAKNPCEISYAESMKELGSAAGISVGASCAAVIKH